MFSRKPRRGASGVEYALLVGLIAVGAIFAIQTTGDRVSGLLSAAGNQINAVETVATTGTSDALSGGDAADDNPVQSTPGVFVPMDDGTVHKLDPDTGQNVEGWPKTVVAGAAINQIAIRPGTALYANASDGQVYKVDPDSGAILDQVTAGGNGLELSSDTTRLLIGEDFYDPADLTLEVDNSQSWKGVAIGNTTYARWDDSANNVGCIFAYIKANGYDVQREDGNCYKGAVRLSFHDDLLYAYWRETNDVPRIAVWDAAKVVDEQTDMGVNRLWTTETDRILGVTYATADGVYAAQNKWLYFYDAATGSETTLSSNNMPYSERGQMAVSADGRIFFYGSGHVFEIESDGQNGWEQSWDHNETGYKATDVGVNF